MFLLVSRPPCCAHPGGNQHGVSIQIPIIWVKHFFGYLEREIFLWPESWRAALYIYLLSFPRFWTLSIERFWFFFLSILNGVTLKTSERDFSWRLYRRRKARKGKGKGVSKGAGVFVFCPPISLTNPITSIVNRWPITSRGASRHGPNLLTFFYTGNCQVVQLSPYKPFRVFRSSFKSAYDFVENLRVQLIKLFE